MESVSNVLKRNLKIDRCRALFMVLIMMAHTIPSGIVMQMRTFDVVGMIFVSILCTKDINNLKEYCIYIKKRVTKLLIPTWSLISVVLLVTAIGDRFLNKEYTYSFKSIVLSYTLIDGIGYVWIVRIFMMLAVLMPGIQFLVRRAKRMDMVFFIALVMILLTDIIYWCGKELSGGYEYFIEFIVIPMVGYVAVTLVALCIKCLDKRGQLLILTACMCFFIVIVWVVGVDINNFKIDLYKYPPRSLYLFYGLFMSGILYCIMPSRENSKFRMMDRIITFVSAYSFEIYFMHIILVKVVQYLENIDIEIKNSYGLALTNIIGAITLVWVKKKLRLAVRDKNE